MKLNLHNIHLAALTALIILLALSYHPNVLSTINANESSILSWYVMLVFSILFLSTFRIKKILKSNVILACILFIVIFVLMLSFAVLFGYEVNIFNSVRPLLITTIAISIGWSLRLSARELTFFIILYSLSVLFVSIQNILTNIGSFVIQEQYATQIKNSIGVMLASSGVMLFFISQYKETSKTYRVLLLAFVILALISLLTLRARTATLTLIFCIIFLIFKKYSIKSKNIFISSFITFLLVFVVYIILPSAAKEYIYQSFTLNLGHNITTGRIERNIQGLQFISDNPFTGNLNGFGNVPLIHNYILLQIYRYGIVFSLGILSFYFYLLIKTLRGVLTKNIFELNNIGYVILVVPFIISFAEPGIPFGPGTVNVFNFIIFGVTLKYGFNQNNSIK